MQNEYYTQGQAGKGRDFDAIYLAKKEGTTTKVGGETDKKGDLAERLNLKKIQSPHDQVPRSMRGGASLDILVSKVCVPPTLCCSTRSLYFIAQGCEVAGYPPK